MRFLDRLVPWLRSPSPKDIFAKTIERAALSQCTREVVIACPEYGDEHFHCEIRIATPVLAQWAKTCVDTTSLSQCRPKNAQEWLAVWLSQANLQDSQPSKIPAEMYAVLNAYITGFVMKEQARVFCYSCQDWVLDVNKEELDRCMEGVWRVWTDRWSCPHGHRLYQETHRMHLQYRRE